MSSPADGADSGATPAPSAVVSIGPEPGAEPGAEIDAELRAFLDREADHFFQGEIAHERRASWLLALASGLMLALWRLLSAGRADALSPPALAFLLATVGALFAAVALSLWALWPLGGGRAPKLLRPWRRRSSWDTPGALPPVAQRFRCSPGTLAWNHYVGHRRRAEIKGRRVVWITLALSIALITGTTGIFLGILT